MTVARNSFLQRVREAVESGNRAGQAIPLEPRGAVGYQGAGPDPVARFRDELVAAGGQFYLVPDREAAINKVIELIRTAAVRRVLLGRGTFLDTLNLSNALRIFGTELTRVDLLTDETSRDAFFAADVGISGVDYLIAETGSVVLLSQPGQPRSLSLLPPIHIAVAERSQLVPDLFDLFESEARKIDSGLASCITLITGPSKTGDIELNLVTGVHGPGQLHVILVGT
jgi:L-lactate utilization protein LutC